MATLQYFVFDNKCNIAIATVQKQWNTFKHLTGTEKIAEK